MKRFFIYAILISTLAASSLFANNTFINAAGNGDIELVKKYIADGVDLNSKYYNYSFSDSQTALMFASKNGHIEIVKLLINSKANIEAKDKLGNLILLDSITNIRAGDSWFGAKKQKYETSEFKHGELLDLLDLPDDTEWNYDREKISIKKLLDFLRSHLNKSLDLLAKL